MYTSNCRAYQRHAPSASTKKITLSKLHWYLIAKKQEEIARERGVRHVSRPVALQAILDEAFHIHVYDPSDLLDADVQHVMSLEDFED